MSHTLTETDSYSDADLLVVPDPGDARKSASVVGPFQKAANHLRYCKNRITEILAQFAGTLSVNNVTASGTVSATTGSFGGLGVGVTGITSTGHITTLGPAIAWGITTLFRELPDMAGVPKKVGPSTLSDTSFDGTIFIVDPQSALGAVQLQVPAGGSGSIVLIRLSALSANNLEVEQTDASAIVTLTPGQTGMFVFDGSVWQKFFVVGP